MKTFERIAMEHWLGIASVEDVERWAEAGLAEQPDDDVFSTLVRGQRRKKLDTFWAYATQQRGFEPVSEVGAREGLVILRAVASQVLRDERKVLEFCRIVLQFDASFVVSEHYPKELTGLYNACDWCDEEWSLSNQPQLREQLERLVGTG